MAAYEKHKLKKSISTIFLLLFHVCKYILKGRLTGLTNRKHLAGTNTIPLHRYCGLHTSETGQRLARVVSCLLRNLTWKKITVPISKFPKATKEIFALPKTMEPIEIHILPGKEILEFKRWCKNKLDPDLREHRPTGS
jgi:hypothetical protein